MRLDYINPMMTTGFDSGAVIGYLLKVGAIYLVSVISGFINTRMFVVITQDIMRQIRNDMFSHMQTLPIRYFDQNTHGNIMSRYTSDIDTLRQMISQSIPQAASSIITLLVVSIRLVSTSWILSLVMVVTVFGIVQVTRFVISRAGGYFIGSGIENFKRLDHKVTVKGLSEREVPANKVTWPLIYKELGNDPSAMYELIEQKNRSAAGDSVPARGLFLVEVEYTPAGHLSNSIYAPLPGRGDGGEAVCG